MATLIVLGLSGFAAYGFSRYRFRGKELALLAVLGTQMLPGVINIIPLYQMMIAFGLLNTLAAVYLILAAMNVPLAVWMLKGFFDSIPVSLDESALVDGASRLYTYFRIVVPLASPGLVAAGVFTFLFSWNEFIIPLTMTSSSSKRLATVALYLFKTPHETNWAGIASGAMLMMVPVILLYLSFKPVLRHRLAGRGEGLIPGDHMNPLARFLKRREHLVFILPMVLYVAVMSVFPVAKSFQLSLTDKDLLSREPGSFIFLENYRILLEQPVFWQVLGNTAVFVLGSVALQFSLRIRPGPAAEAEPADRRDHPRHPAPHLGGARHHHRLHVAMDLSERAVRAVQLPAHQRRSAAR